ncbi:MAG: putative toxin-antitoxin system toxin component, PIN family [Candidatus Latescibacterota bacterium]
MVRVVIDTNVILSALYFSRGNPWRIVMAAIEGTIQNITSEFILEEVRTVLKNKFLWQSSEIDRAIKTIESFSEKVFPQKTISVISCAPDNRILECALEGRAEFIISGDHHLVDLKEFQGISIVNPAIFLSIFRYEEPSE